jgi:anti-sigma regulatory factor (Ser/Thr protein kinase)
LIIVRTWAHQDAEPTAEPAVSGVVSQTRRKAVMTGPASLETPAALAGLDWPLRDGTELDAVPAAVPCARRHTRLLLAEWGLTGLSEQAELVVSELVTNAIAASRSVASAAPVRLWLLTDGARVGIVVWDANPQLPVVADPDELAETGRGLLLVQGVARYWNAYATPQAGGKVVRAICAPGPPAGC